MQILKFKTINLPMLKIYSLFISKLLNHLNIKFKSFMLPTVLKKFTLLKSPHVYKKAREQFQFTRYQQVLVINSKVENSVLKFLVLNKPAEIKLIIKTKIQTKQYE